MKHKHNSLWSHKLKAPLAIALLASLPVLNTSAQGDDFGLDFTAEATKKITNNLDFSVEGEVRTQDNTRKAERYVLGASVGYKLYNTKKFDVKASAGWKYMWFYKLSEKKDHYDDDDGEYDGYNQNFPYWSHRHRTSVALSASYKPNKRWSFQLKETYQYTHFQSDSTKRNRYRLRRVNGEQVPVYKDTDTKVFSAKDKMVLRSKLTVAYNIRNSHFEPFASVDYGFGLNYTTNKWKLTAGTDYKLTKQHKLTLFYRYITEDDDDEPNGHLIGFGYGFKF